MANQVRLKSGTLGRPRPPATQARARFRYGATFLLDALAVMVRDGKLLRRAMVPAAVFFGILALVASGGPGPLDDGSGAGYWRSFYLTIIASAQVSPIIFTKVYARLAAHARVSAGFDPVEPYIRSYGEAAWEAVLQLVGIAVYLGPIAAFIEAFPLIGVPVASLVAFAWASHWSAVEALDAARRAPEQRAEEAPGSDQRPPWFARQPEADDRLYPWRWLTFLPTRWGRVVAPTFRRWFGEIEFMEQRPATALGFTVAVAIILLIPVLNLFARPLTVIAAALWLGHEEHCDASESAA
jgi:hypothetical protein